MSDPSSVVPEGRQFVSHHSSHPLDGSFDEGFWNSFFSSSGLNTECSEHYKTLFKDQDMKPDMLDDMDHSLLMAMGVTKAGHRIKILRAKEKEYGPEVSPKKAGKIGGLPS